MLGWPTYAISSKHSIVYYLLRLRSASRYSELGCIRGVLCFPILTGPQWSSEVTVAFRNGVK